MTVIVELAGHRSSREPRAPVKLRRRRTAVAAGPWRTLMLHGLGSSPDVWDVFGGLAADPCELWEASLPWSSDGDARWADVAGAGGRAEAEALALARDPVDVLVTHSFAANAVLELLQHGSTASELGLRALVLVSPFYRPARERFDWTTIAYYLNHFDRILEEGVRVRSGGCLDANVQHEMALRVRARIGPSGWMRFFETYLATPRLRTESVDVPCLVIAGDRDFAAFPNDAEALADALPDARLEVFRRCGHFAMVERANEFAGLVNAFLETVLTPTAAGAASQRTKEYASP